jgi:sugar phosphate permease
MVFTHLPSAIFLILLPLPSQLSGAITLLVLRSTLASMDQAPRSAFMAAVVLPEERTSVVGIVNMAQTVGRSVGPLFTGLLAAGGKFWVAFVVAGALKAR